jgi:hypothetical protein
MSIADDIRKEAEARATAAVGAVALALLARLAEETAADRVTIMRRIEAVFCGSCGSAKNAGGYCPRCNT